MLMTRLVGVLLSDRANKRTSAGGGIQSPVPRVIGNVVVTCSSCNMRRKVRENDVQLQQREVGVAVVCLVLALLHDIVLEDGGRFRVVPVESVEDLLDVLRPFRRVIEGGAHSEVAWFGCATLVRGGALAKFECAKANLRKPLPNTR